MATKELRKLSATDAAMWSCLFQNELKTQEQSAVFVKRMMALAVSSITYLRGIFPEDAYRSRYLEAYSTHKIDKDRETDKRVEDLCIKLLREDSSTAGASKVVKWMMGCFDALDKGYLHIVLIGVHTSPEDPNHLIESYQFRFKYTAKGPQMDILRDEDIGMKITIRDTKNASMLLIRKMFLLMQNLDLLPNNVFLTMKLYYYDNVTPADYEPPGFKEGLCDTLWFEGTAVHFRVGDLQTPFHSMKVQVAAEQGRVEKLQNVNHQLETTQSLQTGMTEHCDTCEKEDLPSEDDFKKPTKAKTRRKSLPKRLARKKMKNNK